jgi:hypothetical protein
MDSDSDPTQRPDQEEPEEGSAKRTAGDEMGDEDQRVLHLWQENLILQDERYDSKALLMVVAMAMSDEKVRYQLTTEGEAVLDKFRSSPDWPAGVTVKFFENTPDTLNVVLPPRAGEMAKRPVSLREILTSRTSGDAFPIIDDFNVGTANIDPIDPIVGSGDPHRKDHHS